VPASSVIVQVLNGWTKEHAALFFQKKLQADGYDTLAPTDALSDTSKTSVLFVVSPTDMANAQAIATALGLSPSTVVIPTQANDKAIPPSALSKSDLVLVVGEDISSEVPTRYNG
jgi:hypothetical protein